MSSGGEKVCPLCGGTGFIITPRGAKKCRCVYERFNVSKYLNIPKRFWDADIRLVRKILDEESLETLKGFVKDFVTHYKKGVGLLFVGPQGVGKTYIAAALLKYIYTKYGIRGLFTDTKELSIKLRDSFSDQRTKGGLVDALIKVPVLVLDDLGNENLTDWYRDILTGIIARRYNEKRVTIITTNYYPSYLALIKKEETGDSNTKEKEHLSADKNGTAPLGIDIKKVLLTSEDWLLDKRFGSHIVSRLGEMTLPIIVTGKDRRIKKVVV